MKNIRKSLDIHSFLALEAVKQECLNVYLRFFGRQLSVPAVRSDMSAPKKSEILHPPYQFYYTLQNNNEMQRVVLWRIMHFCHEISNKE